MNQQKEMYREDATDRTDRIRSVEQLQSFTITRKLHIW